MVWRRVWRPGEDQCPPPLQGVALLPWIDEARLLGATTPILDQLSEDERRR